MEAGRQNLYVSETTLKNLSKHLSKHGLSKLVRVLGTLMADKSWRTYYEWALNADELPATSPKRKIKRKGLTARTK